VDGGIMAIKGTINFLINVVPDGTSLSVALTLASTPLIVYLSPGYAFNPAFNPSSVTLSGVTNLRSSDGQTITGSVASGVLTINWPVAPTGPQVTVTGNFLF
jgi:hypothetical protein